VRADIGKVRTARRMLKEQYGTKAVRYVFNHEFVTYDGLTFEAIEPLFKAFKDTAAMYLYQGLHAKIDTIVRNSIYFLGRLEVKEAGDTLIRMLADPKNDTLAGSLIVSLGTIKAAQAIPYIAKYVHHVRERNRLRVMVALADIKDTLGIPTLVKGLSDPSFLVRTAAQEALAKFGAPAIKPLEDELATARSDEYRTIILASLRKVFKPMDNSSKTAELKKQLAGWAQPYLHSVYPALKEQAEKLILEVDGKSVLTPSELLLLPEK
jgi:HEAT repeat protein